MAPESWPPAGLAPPSGPAATDPAPGPGSVSPWWATPGVVPAPGFPSPAGAAGYPPAGAYPPGATGSDGAGYPAPSEPTGPGSAAGPYPPVPGLPPGAGYPPGPAYPPGPGYPPGPAYPPGPGYPPAAGYPLGPAYAPGPVYPPGSVGRPPGPLPVRGLGLAVQVLMAVGFVVGAVELVAAWGLARLVDRLQNPRNTVTEADADRADQFQQVAGLLDLLFFVITAVVFLIWFRRLRINAGWWAPEGQRRSQGWAVGGWFVPIVNFWFPFTIATDILAGSRPPGSADRSGQTLLTLWWITWVTQLVLGVAYRGMTRDPRTIDDYATIANTGVAISVVDLVLTVLAVLVVRMLTGLQARRLTAHGLPA